ncbi:hypothetical protein C7999DRAFT_15442 [Corynascus novoguineensis]|uniref:Uncharacterized protein n=1 Tax=Corynascus novoguineensis TaxID=1126955 RepID=A0AAN7HMA7_9PEZI|nr:hypothetical protein C7999DRAFT_15442 [Corynascus novoguineensis]
MHLGWTISLWSVIPLLVSPCLSSPIYEHPRTPSRDLAPRATYSVVPIDGGSGPGGSGNPGGPGSGSGSGSDSGPGTGSWTSHPATVTVIKTLPQKTSLLTVYVTRPPTTRQVTETIFVTKTIKVVDTSLVPSTSKFSISPPFPTSTAPTLPACTTTPLPTGFACKDPSASFTRKYDDGKWHPSYPPWNTSALRRGSRKSFRLRQVA